MDSCTPACTRPPCMAVMQSCPLYHSCKQCCVLLPTRSPELMLLNPPWITKAPREPHILSTYRLKFQPHSVCSLNTWAVWALQVSPYPCVMSFIYSSCLPPSSLPRPEPTFHHLLGIRVILRHLCQRHVFCMSTSPVSSLAFYLADDALVVLLSVTFSVQLNTAHNSHNYFHRCQKT